MMRESAYDTVEWSFDHESGIGRLTLDRPDALNAISDRMQQEVIAAFERFGELDEASDGVTVRAVVITGAGDRAFSSGFDVEEMSDITSYSDRKRIPERFIEMTDAIEEFPSPVVAEIDGLCLGGGLEIALACDFRYASERSSFAQPEVDFGVLPGGGGAQRLSLVVGVSRAKELCMTGKRISAEQAASEGIVDHAYPAPDLREEVAELCDALSTKPPLAVRMIKQAADRTREVGYEEALEYGSQAWPSLASTRDYEKAVEAFGTDDTPEWQGR
jgi:enoyl-CoA hydratase/3-hydroxyacyl-CoA dehydrogenase